MINRSVNVLTYLESQLLKMGGRSNKNTKMLCQNFGDTHVTLNPNPQKY